MICPGAGSLRTFKKIICMNRKNFLSTVAGSAAGIALLSSTGMGQTPAQDTPPPFDAALVKDFVVAGHKDLAKVKAMVIEHPNLVHCKYDWGNGDFEEGIEGAGHMGNREIARFLIVRVYQRPPFIKSAQQ